MQTQKTEKYWKIGKIEGDDFHKALEVLDKYDINWENNDPPGGSYQTHIKQFEGIGTVDGAKVKIRTQETVGRGGISKLMIIYGVSGAEEILYGTPLAQHLSPLK